MAEASTIARPYAQAVFELADQTKKLDKWSEKLTLLSEVAKNEQVAKLITNPNVLNEQLVELISSICADKLDQEGKNFIKALAENGRLSVITEIALIYDAMKAEAEKTVNAEVISAYKLNAQQITKLSNALEKRLGNKVNLTSSVNKSIIGGAIIRAGDLVIDGSVTSQLDRLTSELTH